MDFACTLLLWLTVVVNICMNAAEEVTLVNNCPKNKDILCPCNNNTIVVKIRMCFNEDENTNITTCLPCNEQYLPENPCSQYAHCKTCIEGYKGCSSCPNGRSGRFCEIVHSKFRDIESQQIPNTFELRPGQSSGNRRISRQFGYCEPPVNDPMRQSKIYCTYSSTEITCEETCSWGYTTVYGPSIRTRCAFDEGIWWPIQLGTCTHLLGHVGSGLLLDSFELAPGESSAKRRVPRKFGRCKPPVEDHLRDSKLFCRYSNTEISCEETCPWGFTTKIGKFVTTHCKFNEGIWDPIPLDTCRRYLYCEIAMVEYGSFHCTRRSMTNPDYCRITCGGEPEKTYVCDLEGRFSPALPDCVVQDF